MKIEITQALNLLTDGYVKTSGSNGSLYIDAGEYLPIAGGTMGGSITFPIATSAIFENGSTIQGSTVNAIDPFHRQLIASDGTTAQLDWATPNYLYLSTAGGGSPHIQAYADLFLYAPSHHVVAGDKFVASLGIYDGATSLLSIDSNLRALVASDGTTAMLNWNAAGTIDFFSNSITCGAIYADGFAGGEPLSSLPAMFPFGASDYMGAACYFPAAGGNLALVSDLTSYLSLFGGTMSGSIDMGAQNISNVLEVYGTALHGSLQVDTPSLFGDTISNQSGTGPPNFTHGLSINGSYDLTFSGGYGKIIYGDYYDSSNFLSISMLQRTLNNPAGTLMMDWTGSAPSFPLGIGIGTSSPSSLLHLSKTDYDGGLGPEMRISHTHGDVVISCPPNNNGTNGWPVAGGQATISFGSVYGARLGTPFAVPLTFHTDATARMIIDSVGKVGIGTDVPVSKLSVLSGDIEAETIGNGVILKSPNGTRFRVTIGDDGSLTSTAI